ncbi:sodium:proton antiporter [Fervidicella metallireducens AeB]|uniref:Iron-sulfur cluster carrier protein n=1 Tax=Fervidicella metallireducens AeB TaxID=1403537 RepID=A0A017RR99_9CLOT|nr:Mrp/NBP35 family ATP-binding protein [Fervidicella metallireducens]EYE87293.1 sodium:proton antiporter [Fervidicella metallireducens AeB]
MSNCQTCPSNGNCNDKENCMIENNPMNNVKKIIGVMSGKGGVGKSTVSVLLAKKLKEMGYKVGILDADITGPSIPRLLNISEKRAEATEIGIIPVTTEEGIKVMSLNLLIDAETQPVIWRGPVIAGAVKQFWTDVLWEELDYLIIDMPPGTGDVALTVMQSIPISGVVMVSVPQDLVSMIVAKAIIMARKMNINVLGVVQNMSYIICPGCNEKIKLFDEEEQDITLDNLDINILGEFPMCKEIVDISKGKIENLGSDLDGIVTSITERILKELDK